MERTPLSTEDPYDFSPVLGGPLYQAFLRMRMVRPPLDSSARRMVLVVALAWLPLLVLTLIDGTALGKTVALPFLFDVEANVRLLFAAPLLIQAERMVHERLRGVLHGFLDHGLIAPESAERFRDLVARAIRMRNSVVVEIALLLSVLVFGHRISSSVFALGESSWWMRVTPAGSELTSAGQWYVHVSLAIVQFLLLRWLYRLLVWSLLQWWIARLELRLIPTHPDRAGGLGFLGEVSTAFAPLLIAMSAVISGIGANRILHSEESVESLKLEIGAFACLALAIVLVPLCTYAPRLAQAKRAGKKEHGELAARQAHAFQQEWFRGGERDDRTLLGSADIQSLADMGAVFDRIARMRPVPFGLDTVLHLALAVAVPLLPLVLLVVPVDELVKRVVSLLL